MPTPVKYGKLFMKDAEGTLVQIVPQSSTTIPNYTGATSSAAGSAGLVPAAQSAEREKFLRGDGTWAAAAEPVSDYAGATAGASGTHGLVPAATSAEKDNYLKGDGTWGSIAAPATYVGATGSANGTAGLVPAATIAQKDNYLKGDGTWGSVSTAKEVSITSTTPTSANTSSLDNESIILVQTTSGDSPIIHSSGNETIAGTKTFSSPIVGSVTGTASALTTARAITIEDADGTNSGTGVNFDGSAAVSLKLPSTIKASITGSCSGNAATATALASAKSINISDADATNTGTAISFDGSSNGIIKLPSTIKASITGDCSGSSGSCTGNAATATKLAASKSIALTGDVTGTASFDGSADASISTTMAATIAGNKTFSGNVSVGGNLAVAGNPTCGTDEIVHIPNTAAAHNGVYRGKDLTEVYTLAQLSEKLSDGDFSDLFIGDYITKTFENPAGNSETMDFVFADFDYYMNQGYVSANTRKQGYTITEECKFHHILMVPKDCFVTNAQMNSTNTTLNPTSGEVPDGYVASLMNTTCQTYATKLSANDVFGDHIKPFTFCEWGKVNSTAASAAGAGFVGSTVWTNNGASGWEWVAHKLRLMTEPMVYGGTVFSSSGYDVGNGKSQLSLFRLNPASIIAGHGRGGSRQWWWLGAVASAAAFCAVGGAGSADYGAASGSGGVRPFFLFA